MPKLPITIVDPDSSIEDVKTLLSASADYPTLLLACASFVSKCKTLTKEIESSLEKGTFPPKTSVIIINTDESDELEDIAIELGLKSIPSFQILLNGKVISSGDDATTTYASILSTLQTTLSSSSSSCCPSTPDDIHTLVSSSYAATLNKSQSCCVSVDSTLNGYTARDLAAAGVADADLGLGCGNPLSFAALRAGETVVDLGSGAGIDCFIAAAAVSEGGLAIGVDMTPEMVRAARGTAREKGVENVEFRLGEIENLPVGDGVADCVVSNCVINLSPDKGRVFREIYRILKKGGRIAISDVITRPGKVIPDRLMTAEALACWVSGAPAVENVETFLAEAGFIDVEVKIKEASREVIKQWLPGSGAEDFVVSAEITARK